MASYSYNRFKSTTVFGNFYNSDLSGSTIADAIFDRNVTVKGNTKCSNYIASSDLPTPSESLIPSGYSTFYSNAGIPYFSYNNGTTITTIVLASVSQLSSYLTTALASSTYQTIANMSNYLTISSAASIYQTIANMSNYLTTSSAASIYQTIANMSNYLTTSSAASIYQTIANMSNYLTRGGDIPFNTNIAKLLFLSSFPTTAVNNNNTGIGFFWNQSGGQGETDLVAFGQGGTGGIALYGAGNTYSPSLICRLYSGFIDFSTTPNFPTSNTIGNIGATTQYVDNRLSIVITQGGNIPLNDGAKLSFLSSYPGIIPVNNNNAGIGFYWNSDGHGETDLICYGRTSENPGLTISAANNTSSPLQICTFRKDYIGFTIAPHFVANETIGNYGATTQYVDDRINSRNNSPRRQTWFLSANNVGNSYTAANRNIGASYNSGSAKWDKITTYGGASASNWYITEGIFTAYESGTYNFQICFFTTQTTKVGRFLRAKGSCVLGDSQYLSFNQGYLDNYGSFTISLMYHMNIDDTFFLECENESPTFYYGDGHTTMQIIKIW